MLAKLLEISKQYQPLLEAINAKVYSSSLGEDILLLRWWMELTESGVINKLILPDARRLSEFMRVFSQPTTLVYSLNRSGIESAAWFSPLDSTSKHRVAYAGLYSSLPKSKRFTLDFVYLTYSLAFEFYDALVGITWQPDLLDAHKKLGYNVVGCVPNLYDQPFIYEVHLTCEAFKASRLYKIAQERRS